MVNTNEEIRAPLLHYYLRKYSDSSWTNNRAQNICIQVTFERFANDQLNNFNE